MDVATLDLLTKLKLNKPILNSLVLLLHMYMKEDISLFFTSRETLDWSGVIKISHFVGIPMLNKTNLLLTRHSWPRNVNTPGCWCKWSHIEIWTASFLALIAGNDKNQHRFVSATGILWTKSFEIKFSAFNTSEWAAQANNLERWNKESMKNLIWLVKISSRLVCKQWGGFIR